MRKLLVILLCLMFAIAFLPPFTASAGGGGRGGHGWTEPVNEETETQGHGRHRHSQYAVSTLISETETEATYELEISSLPQTMPDLETLITCEWRAGRDIDGVDYFVTGNNLFSARVTGTRVSAEYEGKLAAWDPQVIVDGTYLEVTSGPTVTNDPLNIYYEGNTVTWNYTGHIGGWWVFGGTDVTVTRYLRQIEGTLLEYYVLDSNPGADVEIKRNYQEEFGFTWERPVTAWDADYNPIPVTETLYGKVVRKKDLRGVTYPVTIDPTVSFTTSSYDGYIKYTGGDSWAATRDHTTGTVYDTSVVLNVRAELFVVSYYIERAFLMFDTSDIPSSATIQSAGLELNHYSLTAESTFAVMVGSGMPTYPHMPLVAGDFDRTHYPLGDGGWISSLDIQVGYNEIPFNSQGIGYINKAGWTKLCLRQIYDYYGTEPTNKMEWKFKSYEWGLGREPKLTVTYTVPVVVPTVRTDPAFNIEDTEATLAGYLIDDGYADCSVRFQYGLTDSYGYTGSPTQWVGGKSTGSYFVDTIYGLEKGTLFHFAAEAGNSAGSDLGDDRTFLTEPGPPSSFTSTPGDTQNSLSWAKGTGSSKTMLRFSTSSYPTSITSGTQIYFDTGVSYDHTSLTNGITYYYSLWAYAASGTLEQYSPTYVTCSGKPVHTGAPLVTTNDATDVEQTTATLHGYLDSLSGYGSAEVKFQYYKGAGTWTDYETAPEELTAEGAFSKAITDLTADTLYHMRAVAEGTGGTTNGSDVPFTTGEICAPTMLTQSATGVTKTGATLHGKVTNDGGDYVTAWFQWGLTTDYGEPTESASGLSTDDSIYVSLVGLTPDTTYHFRIVGENSAGLKGYGDDKSFVTEAPTAPTCTTQGATDVGATSAILHGTVTTDGGVACEVRFQYGLNISYGTNTSWMPGYYSGNPFEQFISGLTLGETYHFIAQVKNPAETADGTDKSFQTVFGSPSNFKADAVSSTSITLSWENAGDKTEVIGKQGSFPTDRFNGEQVYHGPAETTSHGGLSAGTTWFYRAWSWKEGGVYSEDYAEDAATTMAVIAGEDPSVPDITGDLPTAPPEWWQTPSGDAFVDWPFHGIIEDVATSSGIPSGTLWLLLALVAVAAFGIAMWMISGSLMFTVVGIGAAMVVVAIMGLIPLWMMFAFVVIGGALAFLLGRRTA